MRAQRTPISPFQHEPLRNTLTHRSSAGVQGHLAYPPPPLLSGPDTPGVPVWQREAHYDHTLESPIWERSNQNDEITTTIPPCTLQRRTQSKARRHIVCRFYDPRSARVHRGAHIRTHWYSSKRAPIHVNGHWLRK